MKKTGVAIPVAALRSKNSAGCGEFLDLIPFADFCKNSDLKIIQLLPVNDTGTESSPYSSLSAFALHPVYINIEALPEMQVSSPVTKQVLAAVKQLKKEGDSNPRFNYRKVRAEKLSLLRKLYDENADSILADKKILHWIESNPWISEYAVFMRLKALNNEASWKEWKKYKKITAQQIEELWNNKSFWKDHLFYAWIQFHLDEQFSEAASYVKSAGIQLKGDIPIMMNEDSHDIWAHPEFFRHDLRAGSPVDAMNPVGQNWGFPTYNWANLKKADYSWWVGRLAQAAAYYQLYRIDHVLGFFRIWAIPDTECTAVLGHTEPYEPITTAELKKLGFSDERIRWLCKPHVPTRIIEEVNGNDYLGTHGLLHTIMDRIGEEELWLFKSSIKGDKDIWAREDLPQPVRERLAEKWRDRMLVETEKGKYFPNWIYEQTSAWQSLSEDEKAEIKEFFREKSLKNEYLWEKQARELLTVLTGCTGMKACAEDLGANVDCLPSVLDDLGICGLRVVRWNRRWEKEGKPFVPFAEYPKLSVTTSSVHDSSTLRIWWISEPDAADFFKEFPPAVPKAKKSAQDEKPAAEIKPGVYSPETASYLLKTMAATESSLFIPPVQDFLGLVDKYYTSNPEDERINLPGSVNEFNWTYRLPVKIEDLLKDKKLSKEINAVVKIHDR